MDTSRSSDKPIIEWDVQNQVKVSMQLYAAIKVKLQMCSEERSELQLL